MQKATSNCECGGYWGQQCEESGDDDDMVTVEYMPEHLRASGRSGAIRLRVLSDCAELIAAERDDWATVQS